MKKIIVTYDYDDVLTALNEYCIKALNLDKELITRFELDKTLLSEQDKKVLLEYYRDVNSYKLADWYDGIDDVVKISQDPRVDFRIHSHIISKEIGEYKEKRLLAKGFNRDCLYLQEGKEKEMQDTDIMVDDRILNLVKSPGKYKILYNQPWNQEAHHPEFRSNIKHIIRAKDLKQVNKLVGGIIEEWITEQYN